MSRAEGVKAGGGDPSAGTGLYQFCHNSVCGERDRLEAVDRVIGGGSRQLLLDLGLGPGWRCADVGAGAGTLSCWLTEQVGPDGLVVATDLDTSLLEAFAGDRLEVRRHDITVESLEEASYDLVFARAVLCHLPQRERALQHMIAALRPGGLVVLQDMDIRLWAATFPENADYTAVVDGIVTAMTPTGWCPDWSVRQPVALVAAGARDVGTRTWVDLIHGGTPEMQLIQLTFSRMADLLVDKRLVTSDQMAAALACCADPSFTILSGLSVAAWGRRSDGS